MFKKHVLSLAVLASIGAASVAQADEIQDKRWYVAPFATFLKTGGDRDAKDGWGGGLGIGKMIDKHFNVEIKGVYQGAGGFSNPADKTATGRWDLTGGSADVQYYFTRGKFSPYSVVGLGALNTHVHGGDATSFTGEAGAGFTYELHDNFMLRSDVRYRYNHNFNGALRSGTDEYHDMTVNVGFVVPFGAKPHAVAEKVELPVAAAPTPTPSCSSLDSDSDGVNDCNDKCQGTIAGSKVDAQGCPLRLELKGVTFKLDSAQLTPNAMVILDDVAQNLMAYPDKNDIEVHGHTSSEGSTAHNQKLSQRRSQAVADYLASKGVSNHMYARGFGESQPVADNSTEEGRSQNRRVELVWTGK